MTALLPWVRKRRKKVSKICACSVVRSKCERMFYIPADIPQKAVYRELASNSAIFSLHIRELFRYLEFYTQDS